MEQSSESPGEKTVFLILINLFLFVQEIIDQENQKGGENTRNCPLVATLRMFFSSARTANKKSGGEQGSGWEMLDGASDEGEE